MAAYMRKRRAKQKAEREAAVRADAALPRDAILKAGEGEIAVVKADIAAIRHGGGRALITKVDGRLRAIDDTSCRTVSPPAPTTTLSHVSRQRSADKVKAVRPKRIAGSNRHEAWSPLAEGPAGVRPFPATTRTARRTIISQSRTT
jgi:hypothetical protein